MTDKVHIVKWLKGKLANLCNEIQCEVPELPKDVIKGKILAFKEILFYMKSLQKEPVSEDLEKAARNHLWKDAQGDDLPEIDREVVVLIQDYPDDKDHLRVAFAHRPTKYTKVWNPDLGEEQIIEIERHGKGEWNIPDVKYWLDVELPKD